MNYLEYTKIPKYQDGEKISRGAYYVTFPDHKITVDKNLKLPLGHGAVITVGPNGVTQFYEYGRYDGKGIGVKSTDSDPIFNQLVKSNNTGIWQKKAFLI